MKIAEVETYVKKNLEKNDAGHDWSHTDRVRRLSLEIYKSAEFSHLCESEKEILVLTALLHDVGDEKFFDGDIELRDQEMQGFIISQGLDITQAKRILKIIKHISFSGGNNTKIEDDIFRIVQDADRLEALGAIGIARTFHYGGHKGDKLYDPKIKARNNMTKIEYRNQESTTVNHFYEKLLKLKYLMNTEKGKQIAGKRHEFMEQFLEQFYDEWNCKI